MRVSLTFDDGPSEWTEAILDELAAHGARGTFFVCGWAVDGREATLRRMVSEGHEIGNHGWSHTAMWKLTYDEVADELRRTEAAILGACGVRTATWRAPQHNRPDHALRAARDLGYPEPVFCTIDPGDWHQGGEEVVAETLAALHEDAIINLHDGVSPRGSPLPDRAGTIYAVRHLLAHMESVPVSELTRTDRP